MRSARRSACSQTCGSGHQPEWRWIAGARVVRRGRAPRGRRSTRRRPRARPRRSSHRVRAAHPRADVVGAADDVRPAAHPVLPGHQLGEDAQVLGPEEVGERAAVQPPRGAGQGQQRDVAPGVGRQLGDDRRGEDRALAVAGEQDRAGGDGESRSAEVRGRAGRSGVGARDATGQLADPVDDLRNGPLGVARRGQRVRGARPEGADVPHAADLAPPRRRRRRRCAAARRARRRSATASRAPMRHDLVGDTP